MPLAATLPSVWPVQTEVLEEEGTILFTHRLKDGAVDNSYGLEVARLAGIPAAVLKRADQYLAQHNAREAQPQQPRAVQGASVAASASALANAASPPLERFGLGPHGETHLPRPDPAAAGVLERLAALNINRLSPLQALNMLSQLQGQLSGNAALASFLKDLAKAWNCRYTRNLVFSGCY